MDATPKLKPARPRLRVLKSPAMSPEEGKVMDRRRQHAVGAAADALKPEVLKIVQVRQQIARRGALVTLDHSYIHEVRHIEGNPAPAC